MSYQELPIGTNSTPIESSRYLPVKVVPQSKKRYGFDKVISNNVDTTVMTIIGAGVGSGQSVNQSAGNLVLTSGTTVRSETIIRSIASWQNAITLRFSSVLSQRIINNNFIIELVDVMGDSLTYVISSATVLVVTIPGNTFTSQNVGQTIKVGLFAGTGTFLSGSYPIASIAGNDITFTVSGFAAGTGTCSVFGWNHHHIIYDSTTATTLLHGAQRNGWPAGNVTATTNTSASPGHIGIINSEDGVATFADQLAASATTIQTLVRSQISRSVPESVTALYLQIRMFNGTTAPASTTTWTIGFVDVENYTAQQVSLTSARVQSNNSALPVEVLRAVAQSATITSVVAGTSATNLGKAEDAVAASGDTGIFVLGVRRDAPLVSGSATGDYNELATNRWGALLTAPFEKTARSYVASCNIAVGSITTPTDIFTITGNGTTVVYITRITITAVQTTGGVIETFLIKRSTANTGGTSSSVTALALDSGDAAAAATLLQYTVNPAALGTVVGNIKRIHLPAPAVTGTPAPTTFEFGDKSKPIVLTGVTQQLAVNLNSIAAPAGAVYLINIEWFEI